METLGHNKLAIIPEFGHENRSTLPNCVLKNRTMFPNRVFGTGQRFQIVTIEKHCPDSKDTRMNFEISSTTPE